MRFFGKLIPSLLSLLAVPNVIPAAWAQYTQQGAKLVGAYNPALTPPEQGTSVAISADGNTAVVGGPGYVCGTASDPQPSSFSGAAWIFTRSGGAWTGQGPRLAASDAMGQGGDCWGGAVFQGSAVGISADGNTVIVGGFGDNNGIGAAWIYTRTNGAWSQQKKLVGLGYTGGTAWYDDPYQGISVAISGDGNTAIAGGIGDNHDEGSAWVFTRTNGSWSQGARLAGSSSTNYETQGSAVALSYDGNTAAIAGTDPYTAMPFVSVLVRANGIWSQQGGRLSPTGPPMGGFGNGPAGPLSRNLGISDDGNTIVLGADWDGSGAGSTWVFTRSGGVWSQQGGKLVGAGAAGTSLQGSAVAISGDGTTIAIGGPWDSPAADSTGAVWVFRRSNGVWNQQGAKLLGTGAASPARQGYSVALSSNGSTLIEGGPWDSLTTAADPNWRDTSVGAAWIFVLPSSVPAPVSASAAPVAATSGTFTFTFSDSGGYQKLTVVDVLIRDVLDGRQACYLAFVPSGPSAGSLYLVDDAGDAGGPYSGMLLPGSGSISNSHCTVTGAGSSASGAGNTLTLTLPIAFTGFAGYKALYLAAGDASANSGWSALGTFNVTGAAPAGPWVALASPARANGFNQTFQFTFTDPGGWQNIAVADVLINGSIDGRHACYVALVPINASSVSVLLVDDGGDAAGPFAGLVAPGGGTAANSQCSIPGQGSSVNAAGNTLTVTLPIAFTQSFIGNQIVYGAVGNKSGQNSKWQAIGTAGVR